MGRTYNEGAAALVALKLGKTLKRSTWLNPNSRIYMSYGCIVDDHGDEYISHYRDILALTMDSNYNYVEWEAPKGALKLTPDMVGKRMVKLRDGQIRMISGSNFGKDVDYPFYIGDGDWVRIDGTYCSGRSEDHRDVVEVLP